jgi:TOTE conflict system, Archaeo-Eukaryotic Primase domain
MARRLILTPALVKAYIDLFVNRRAYTIQSIRPHPESGRHYYFRPKQRDSGGPLLLNEKTIADHLEGQLTIGLYAINPANQRCKWVAIDADYPSAMDHLIRLQYQLSQDHVESALEMSRRGGHLWIFMAVPLLARKCRIYINDLAQRLGVPIKRSGLAEGIEVFPKHDEIQEGAFGNALRGPLGIHRAARRRFWFYGADYTLEAQMTFLTRLRRLTEAELDRFTEGKELPPNIAKVRLEAESPNLSQLRRGKRGFHILDYVAETRVVGRNYVTRCPSCALLGHDRGRDNLAILVSDPRFYQCWAGCSKQMIRAALGQPIQVEQGA